MKRSAKAFALQRTRRMHRSAKAFALQTHARDTSVGARRLRPHGSVGAGRRQPDGPVGARKRQASDVSGARRLQPSVVIGLIADTHGLFRPDIVRAFEGVSLILHAGDVGGASVLRELRKLAPVEAVYGNVDDRHDPMLTRARSVTLEGVTIHVSHGDELGRPTAELALARYAGDVVVFGHTHKAVTLRDKAGRLAVNPGAAGPRRFGLKPSVARLTVDAGRADVEIISLA
jgi:hypothetical protein